MSDHFLSSPFYLLSSSAFPPDTTPAHRSIGEQQLLGALKSLLPSNTGKTIAQEVQ